MIYGKRTESHPHSPAVQFEPMRLFRGFSNDCQIGAILSFHYRILSSELIVMIFAMRAEKVQTLAFFARLAESRTLWVLNLLNLTVAVQTVIDFNK